MAIEKRDWIMLGIGAGITLIIATSIGRRSVMSLMGFGKTEIDRALSKIEQKIAKRAALD